MAKQSDSASPDCLKSGRCRPSKAVKSISGSFPGFYCRLRKILTISKVFESVNPISNEADHPNNAAGRARFHPSGKHNNQKSFSGHVRKGTERQISVLKQRIAYRHDKAQGEAENTTCRQVQISDPQKSVSLNASAYFLQLPLACLL
jgi:hypothetical protein